MNQVLVIKLAPTPEQHAALLRTLETFNIACNDIAGTAFELRSANKIELQKLVYYDIRDRFGLSAQMCIRAIAKVAEAYKRDREKRPTFRAHGAMTYDERILSFPRIDRASLLTLEGRIELPFRFGAYQEARRDRIRGQADLLYRNGVFFLACTVDAPEPSPTEVSDFLGVDLGVDLGVTGRRPASQHRRDLGWRDCQPGTRHYPCPCQHGARSLCAAGRQAPKERNQVGQAIAQETQWTRTPLCTVKNIEAHERGMSFNGSVIGHLSETEKGYLAGIIDGEGCIRLSRRPGKHGAPIYHIYVVVVNTSMALHHWLEQRLPGVGYIREDTRRKRHAHPGAHPENWRTVYNWVIMGNRVAVVFLREIAPYLIVKSAQAELLAGGYVHLSAEERDALYTRLHQLKREA